MVSVYWISTSLIALTLVLSAGSYLISQSAIEGVRALGFPDYFRIQLAFLKIIAVFVLLIPGLPMVVKEWAYAGVGFFLITAIVAHYVHRDPLLLNMINVGIIVLCCISRISYSKLPL